MEEQIKILGKTVVDNVTNFKGEVSGIVFYTDRATECLIEAKAVENKKPVSRWLTFTRLRIVTES